MIYLPEAAVEPIERILRCFSRMDRGRLPCELLPIRPGDEIILSRELVVTVSATVHTVPSLGFVVWQRRRKLKPEFQALPGDQIRDLRLGGAEVTSEVRTPRVAYLGDSAPGGLDACPAMFEAEVLIMELTFVAPSHRKDKIHKFGHMHLDDFMRARGPLPQRADRCLALQYAVSSPSDPPARREGPARHARRTTPPVDLSEDCQRSAISGQRSACQLFTTLATNHQSTDMSQIVRFSVSLEDDLLEQFDRHCREQHFATRSEAVRQLVRDTLTAHAWESDCARRGGHADPGLRPSPAAAPRPSDPAPARPHDLVVSTLHAHLTHDLCLEVIVLRGPAARLQHIASQLRGLKGIRKGELVMASAGR